MKFKCSAPALIEGLQIVVRALSARTTNAILEGILIEAEAGQVTLTCSDERMTIVNRIPAEVPKPGRGVVPGKLFNEVARRLSDGDIEITMNERFMFTVRGSGSRTNISGQDPDLYPALPRVDEEHELALPQDLLKEMIAKTEFAIAVEDMREMLTGAYLEIEGGDVTMVGLDGFRMAVRRARCADVTERLKAIIPGRAAGDIGKLLSDDPDAFCTLRIGGGKLNVRLENTDIYVILIGGDYIQYKNIIPPSFATAVTVDLEPFGRAVDRAALIAREGNNNLLVLRVAGGEMAIESRSEIGDVFEKLDVQQQGPDITIAFNVKYLTDVVRSIEDDRVKFSLNTPISPCVITPVGDADYLHLVLPVRTGATN